MYVHVVKRGENLLQIGRGVGVSAEELIGINGITDEDLVPGLSLLVPTKVPTALHTYTVRASETLRGVANRHRVPERMVIDANLPLPVDGLPVGRVLTLPVPMNKRGAIEVNMRLEVQGEPEEVDTVEEAGACLSSVSLCAAVVEGDGELREPFFERGRLGEAIKGADLGRLLLIAPSDPQAAERVVAHGPTRRAFFAELRPLIGHDGYRGVHLEFTALPPKLRFLFTGFVRELHTRLRQWRGELYVSVPPMTESDEDHPRTGAYDLEMIGQYADRVVWNADEAYGRWDSPPTSLAPLHLIRRTLTFAQGRVAAGKLLLGLPFYGYDWEVPYEPDLSPSLVLQVPPVPEEVTERPGLIHWDDRALSPMFQYRDETGKKREVWYEDVRSLAAKLHLVREYGLAGISCHVQGIAPVAIWQMLSESFSVRR
ncbi:glycosyl hydrolase family 18 protein [Tumebacillus lacus]|nr:glycosyl hydrolase family 18 protein [Tumebacillus lacus]